MDKRQIYVVGRSSIGTSNNEVQIWVRNTRKIDTLIEVPLILARVLAGARQVRRQGCECRIVPSCENRSLTTYHAMLPTLLWNLFIPPTSINLLDTVLLQPSFT